MGSDRQILLDTHALFWWLKNDPQLSAEAREAITSTDRSVFVSAVSALELGTKHRLGKLPGGHEIVSRYHELIARNGFELLDVTSEQAMRAALYSNTHRDPFDRILAAQSDLTGSTLVTRDPAFVHFPCRTLW